MDYLKERWIVSNDDGMYQIKTEGDLPPSYIVEAYPGIPADRDGVKALNHICDLHNSSLDKKENIKTSAKYWISFYCIDYKNNQGFGSGFVDIPTSHGIVKDLEIALESIKEKVTNCDPDSIVIIDWKLITSEKDLT